MLLLWSRLAAFALMASLTTCSPLPVSPFKAVDTASSLEHAPGPEQVTNFQQRDISVPSGLNVTPPSILTSEISSSDIPTIKVHGSLFHSGQENVGISWKPTIRPRRADIWMIFHRQREGTASDLQGLLVSNIVLARGSYNLVLPSWKDLKAGDADYVRAALFFGYTTNNYIDRGVFGDKTPYFTIKKSK